MMEYWIIKDKKLKIQKLLRDLLKVKNEGDFLKYEVNIFKIIYIFRFYNFGGPIILDVVYSHLPLIILKDNH